MTATLTAKTIRAAATSVAGARGMGIVTAASDAAPDLLERAEAVLSSMLARAAGMEPSSPNQDDERRYYAAASMADAYLAAVDDLRAALGLETHADRQARERADRNAAARAARDLREEEDAEKVAAESVARADSEKARFANDFAAAWPKTVRRFGKCYDRDGQRVALIVHVRYSEGRMSSLGGWNPGGDECGRSEELVSETGRALEGGEWVSVRDGGLRQVHGTSLSLAGVNCVPFTPATSDWLPSNPQPPVYRNDWDCQCAWDAAFEDRRLAKATKKQADEKLSASPFSALAALKGKS